MTLATHQISRTSPPIFLVTPPTNLYAMAAVIKSQLAAGQPADDRTLLPLLHAAGFTATELADQFDEANRLARLP